MHYKRHLFFCTNARDEGRTCCANGQALPMFEYAKTRLKDLGAHGPGKVRVSRSGCMGRCSLGPTLVVYPDAVWYRYQSEQDIETIIQQHILGDKIVPHLLMDQATR